MGEEEFRERRLVEALSALFPSLGSEGIGSLRSQIRWITLRGGEVLFSEGEDGDAAYLVVSGRLRAVAAGPRGERLLGEIGVGETVGELALISEGVRSATVYAARDSQLARIGRTAFDELTERHPAALRRIAGFVVERLRRIGAVEPRPPLSSIAVVPSRPGEDLERLTRRLEAELARYGEVLRVDRRAVETALGRRGIADVRDGEPGATELVRWLSERDAAVRFMLYQTDPAWTPWTERAIRQADHVLVVAMTKHGPELGETETRLASIWSESRPPGRSLVLLHSPGASPANSEAWLGRRNVERHYHVRGESLADVARLARLLIGRGVGLVLGGGGARGFAHLGVLRALETLEAPVDAIGGTSMGAIVGALAAMGKSSEECLELCRRHFSELFDPTLPVVSLLAGRRIGQRLAGEFGALDLADLPIPYFCVSTNLSQAEEVVHRRGPLFRAVRASISLPGILPPVALDGDLHVDGGLVDNLPIDTMARDCGGEVIAVDVSPEEDLRSQLDLAGGVSGWRLLSRRINPFRTSLDLPYISSVLMRSTVVASLAKQRQRGAEIPGVLHLKPAVERWGLLEFEALESIARRGFEASLEPLRGWGRERDRAFRGRGAGEKPLQIQ